MAAGLTLDPSTPRIALFFSNFHGGGIQRVMLNLAAGLVSHNLRVDLVLVQAEGPLLSQIPAGCRLLDLRAGHAAHSLFKLARYLQTERPAALLSSQTHLNIIAILARAWSGWRGRLLASEHITLGMSAQHPLNWKERFFPLLAGLFYRWADEIILVSRETAQHFISVTGLPARRVTVIYNPIVTANLLSQASLAPAPASMPAPGAPVILAAGRLTPQKDFATLLRAFALLRHEMPSAQLVILGEGPELANLQKLAFELGIRDCTCFPGFVPNPFACMANSSVFVLSSRWEGFANVLVEAMACGAPVVSTDCPSGPSEILSRGEFGPLVPVGDPAALAGAILAEIKNPHDSQLLRQRADDFSIERILPQYLALMLPTDAQ